MPKSQLQPQPAEPSAFLFWAGVGIVVVGTMGATFISPLFGLYREKWDLGLFQITLLYSVYMGGCLFSLLFLNRLTPVFGPKRALSVGTVFSVLGLVMTSTAYDLWAVGLGRVFMGLATGVITASAAVAMMENMPKSLRSHAAQWAAAITAIGFTLGPVSGGVLGQTMPQPLTGGYLVLLALSLPGFLALFLSPRGVKQGQFTLRPGFAMAGGGTHFASASAGVFLAFMLFGFMASVAPGMIGDAVPFHGPLADALPVVIMLILSTLMQFMTTKLPSHWGLALGQAMIGIGMVPLILALQYPGMALFGAALLLVGLGHGLCFMHGLALVTQKATPQTRAPAVAAYYVVGYVGTIFPNLALGYLADQLGPAMGGQIYAGFAICLAVFGLWLWAKYQRPRQMV